MKPAPVAYTRPRTVAEAVDALRSDPEAKVLAGGQSLVPLLSMRLAAPSLLVDINRVDGLAELRVDETGVHLGALVRQATVEADPAVRRTQPLLPRALRLVAHPTIRNRGTCVGSIVHADPAAELPAVLRLLDGSVTLASAEGERQVPADDLYVGPLECTVRPAELVTSAHFPPLPDGAGVACDEVARRHGDYALCGVAALVQAGADGAVTSARVAYCAMAEVPVAVDVTECLAQGLEGGPDDRALDAAADLALERLDPETDVHATAAYRTRLARTLTRRMLRAAHAEATRTGVTA